MTMVDVGYFTPYLPLCALAVNGSVVIDAANEVAAGVCQVKAGNIRYIHWRTNTVTTGGTNNVDVRLETVNAANGNPSGSLWGTNTNASVDVTDANDNTWFRTQLTADATVAEGDVVAALIVNPATNFGSMQIATGFYMHGQSNTTGGMPYGVSPTRAGLGTVFPCFLFEYDDGTFNPAFGVIPFVSSSQSFATDTDPDEVCLVFTPDAPFRVAGWGLGAGITAGGDWRMALYEDGNNTPLLTSSTQDGNVTGSGANRLYTGFFSSKHVVTVGTKYRLAVVPLTTADVVQQILLTPGGTANTAVNAAQFQVGKRNRSGTTDPDAAAWTDTDDIPCIWIIADQLDNGVGTTILSRRDYSYRARQRTGSMYAGV